jgi:hypothetical protein
MMILTRRQARQFLLLKHGLLDDYRFTGKAGVLNFVRQVGCIQYDPVDVCGKNAELVLQSRVEGFNKAMLEELLYVDRKLVDYPDKNLAIFSVADWPYFERYRQVSRHNAARYPKLAAGIKSVRNFIAANGPVCSDDLKLDGELTWRSAIHWSGSNKLSRAVLEQMYSTGDLIIHHKKNTRKYYDLAERHIPAGLLSVPEPLPDELEHRKWRVLRRIGAVGLLWNRPSDAWLNIWGLKSGERNEIFRHLVVENKILEVTVEGLKDVLYFRAEDLPLLEAARQNRKHRSRCELIAPLDNFIWDRKLIRALFGFSYTWEIYTPPSKRLYGSYVLPILYGEELIGRVEATADRKTKTLVVKNLWYEESAQKVSKLPASIDNCLKRFAVFNGCEMIK